MSYEIHLDVFQGPFDLLLHLIEKNQVDIYDIPIAEITRQYLDYLRAMESLDLEIASSFLVMAAQLLAIKARLLLPKPSLLAVEEEEEDAREELVRDLLEYKRYKEAAACLEQLAQEQSRFLARPNEAALYLPLFAAPHPLAGKTLADLTAAFQAVLARWEEQEPVLAIAQEEVTVRDKREEIYQALCASPTGCSFSRVFASCRRRTEMVVTFLALLELIRQKILHASQNQAFGEIYLYPSDLERYQRLDQGA